MRLSKINIFYSVSIALFAAVTINSSTWFRLHTADYYTKNKNFDRAITIYTKILRKESINPRRGNLDSEHILDIHYKLAKLFLTQGKHSEAARVLRKIVDLGANFKIDTFYNTQDPESCKSLGLALFHAGLKNEGIRQFKRAFDLKPYDAIGHYKMALIYKNNGEDNRAIEQFERVVESYEKAANEPGNDLPACYLAGAYYRLALKLENDSMIKKAEEYYNKAVSLGGSRVPGAYCHLKDLYLKEGKNQDAADIEKKLIDLRPPYEVGYKVDDNLILLGYSLDEKEFEIFNKGEITFFWEINSPGTVARDDIYRIDNRLYEIKEMNNLAPNFGFENDSIYSGFPDGWDTDCYGAYSAAHELVMDSLPSGRSKCLLLNNARALNTNCQTDYISVTDDFYLQAGWVRSAGGSAYLGRVWFDKQKKLIHYNYVIGQLKTAGWKYYSEVLRILPNSAYCRLWAINFGNNGKAYFDDVIFIKVRLPAAK